MSNLSQPGTFAGNDAIVAFARSQQVKVVIHQLNMPLWEVSAARGSPTFHKLRRYLVQPCRVLSSWQINGSEKQVCRQLHIAYRYGDHYDSVRRTGDNSESPAQLRVEVLEPQFPLSNTSGP